MLVETVNWKVLPTPIRSCVEGSVVSIYFCGQTLCVAASTPTDEPSCASPGTVMVTCTRPWLSVYAVAGDTWVEFSRVAWLLKFSVALNCMRTFGLGVPAEFVSCAVKTTDCPGFAGTEVMLPEIGEIQLKMSP